MIYFVVGIIFVLVLIGYIAQIAVLIASNIFLFCILLLALLLINIRKINIIKIILTLLVIFGLIFLRINPESDFTMLLGLVILLLLNIIIIITIIEIIDSTHSEEERIKRKERKKIIIKNSIKQIGLVILICLGLVLANTNEFKSIKGILYLIILFMVFVLIKSTIEETKKRFGINVIKESDNEKKMNMSEKTNEMQDSIMNENKNIKEITTEIIEREKEYKTKRR